MKYSGRWSIENKNVCSYTTRVYYTPKQPKDGSIESEWISLFYSILCTSVFKRTQLFEIILQDNLIKKLFYFFQKNMNLNFSVTTREKTFDEQFISIL